MIKNRVNIGELKKYIGQEVNIYGWVNVYRNHGKLIFLDLRDRSGQIQLVILPNHEKAHFVAQDIKVEWALHVTGIVNNRAEKLINQKEANGAIEIEVTNIEVINESDTPPFDITTAGEEIGEDIRLKYRYLDLRRPRMQRNLRIRHKVIKAIRDYLDLNDFIEVETPILTKSTPEGARDYVVPSRIYKGKFFALPQSPQQYKQLLMVGGVEKYFQIAKCLRDEDTRADRQPEFTQLDLEMSFVRQEDVMELTEKLLIHLVETIAPEKKIQKIPFPRIPYKEAMEKYGIDRPDLREDKNDCNSLAFCWVINFPFFEKTEDGNWTFTHNPFSSPVPDSMGSLMNKQDVSNIIAAQYDIVLNGFEIGGGSIRNHKPKALRKVFEIMGYSNKQIDNNFGHMLKALSYGAPSHGGIAWGLDRLVSLMLGESSIREVIAFSKTGDARDLMMDSPSELSDSQLKELGLSIDSKDP